MLLSDSAEDMLTVGTNKVIISGNNALHRAPRSVACSECRVLGVTVQTPESSYWLAPSHSQQGSISVHTIALSTPCNSPCLYTCDYVRGR